MRRVTLLFLASILLSVAVPSTSVAEDDPAGRLLQFHAVLLGAAGVQPLGADSIAPESIGSCSGYSIACGQTVSHTSFRCALDNGNGLPVDDYDIYGSAGQTVTARATSTYLFVAIYRNGVPVAVGGGPSTSSTVSYTFPTSGTYQIYVVSSYSVAYTLTVTCSGSAPPPPPPPSYGCNITNTTLCLLSNRFRVSVNWRVPSQGTSGVGTALTMTSDTGYFWFFSSSNVELVVKVLDGRALNNKYWVFFGALSDVEYTITVTDTSTGAVRTYGNLQGRMASVADTSAF